ncbi:unnamed protein product [Jaminaea pallidilutea]
MHLQWSLKNEFGAHDGSALDRLSACLASSSTLELPLVNLLSAALGKMAKDQLLGPYGTQFNAAYFERQKDVHATIPWIVSSLCAISSNLLQLNGSSAVNAVELEETLRRMDAIAFPATTVYPKLEYHTTKQRRRRKKGTKQPSREEDQDIEAILLVHTDDELTEATAGGPHQHCHRRIESCKEDGNERETLAFSDDENGSRTHHGAMQMQTEVPPVSTVATSTFQEALLCSDEEI